MTAYSRVYTNIRSPKGEGKKKTRGSHTKERESELKTTFNEFSRTQIDFSRALKFTLTPTLPRS